MPQIQRIAPKAKEAIMNPTAEKPRVGGMSESGTRRANETRSVIRKAGKVHFNTQRLNAAAPVSNPIPIAANPTIIARPNITEPASFTRAAMLIEAPS